MKRFLLLVTFISLLSLTQAQEFHYGVFAGVNINNMKVDDRLLIGTDPEFCNKKMPVGFNGGAFAEYSFNHILGIQAELGFAQYGYGLKTDGEYDMEGIGVMTEKGMSKTTVNSINLALMLKCYLFDQTLAIDLGVQPNFACSVRQHIEHKTTFKMNGVEEEEVLDNIDETLKLNKGSEFNPFDLSAIAGVTYYIDKNIFVTARYLHGFMNTIVLEEEALYIEDGMPVTKTVKTEFTSKRRTVQLTVGWRF